MRVLPFADVSGAVPSVLTNVEFRLVCPQANCASVSDTSVVQILSFICHLQSCAGGELAAVLRKLNRLRLDCGLIASKRIKFLVSVIWFFGLSKSKSCHQGGGC